MGSIAHRARPCEWDYDWPTISEHLVILVLLTLLGVSGCCPPWLEAPFQTAYSAVGAQVK